MSCFTLPIKKERKNLSYVIVNKYAYGMPWKVVRNMCDFHGINLTWRKNGIIERNLKKTTSYCIDGCSMKLTTSVLHIEEAAELIHYTESSDKDVEALNCAIEKCIQVSLNPTLELTKKGLIRGISSNKQWSIAQTVYVLCKKENNQKYKNLHKTKSHACLLEAKKLKKEVTELYDYFMRDNDVFIKYEDHIRWSKKVEQEEYFEYVDVKIPAYTVYEEVVSKSLPFSVSKEYGKIYNYTGYLINEEEIDKFIKEKNIVDNYKKNAIRTAIHNSKKGEITKNVIDMIVPKAIYNSDFSYFSKTNEYNVMNNYKDYSEISGRFFMVAKEIYSDEELNHFESLNSMETENLLRIKYPGLGKKAFERAKRELRKEIEEKRKRNNEKTYKEVVIPESFKTEKISKIKEKVSYIPILQKDLKIESSERHVDFIKHSFEPEVAIQLRNAKQRLRQFNYFCKYTDFPKFQHMNNLLTHMGSLTKKIRRLFEYGDKPIRKVYGGRLIKNQTILDLVAKKRKTGDEFLELYRKFRIYEGKTKKSFDNKDPDFNKYDFGDINLLKREILLSEMVWSRGVGYWNKEKHNSTLFRLENTQDRIKNWKYSTRLRYKIKSVSHANLEYEEKPAISDS